MLFKNGEVVKLNDRGLSGELYQFRWGTDSHQLNAVPIDKYSAERYFNFDVISTKKDTTLSSIDKEGTITAISPESDSDDIKITCSLKDNKEVQAYITASVTTL